jgi:hypothetical protein
MLLVAVEQVAQADLVDVVAELAALVIPGHSQVMYMAVVVVVVEVFHIVMLAEAELAVAALEATQVLVEVQAQTA